MNHRGFKRKCPLCQKSLEKDYLSLGKTTVLCPECSLVFNYNLPELGFKKKWENFTFNSGVLEYDLARTDFFKDFWDYSSSFVQKKTGRVLDIGCGRGIILKLARQSGWEAEGVELSERLCQEARNYSGCKVYKGPLEELDIPDESYDIILMVDTFRHLINPLDTLKNCARLCKGHGVTIIRDLNLEHSSSRKRLSKSLDWDLQCLSPETGRLFMEKAGLKDVQFFPSLMSFLTLPAFQNIHKKNPRLANQLRKLANKAFQVVYYASFRRWLSITPEMIVVGKKD